MENGEAGEIQHSKEVIEITPEMIEAGARELLLYDDDSDRRETVRRILEAALQSGSFHRR